MRSSDAVFISNLSYRTSEVNAAPKYRSQVSCAIESVQAEDPQDQQHGNRGQENLGAAEEG